MSRSTFAVPYIDPKFRITYILNSIMSERGYKQTVEDGEEVFRRENEDCNLTEFVKFDFDTDVFIYSVWIKLKDDADFSKEYNLDHFGRGTRETKKLDDLVCELYNEFGGNFKLKKFYVWGN